MNVAENLYDYLKNNEKAELVGFGTFYVKNSSAKINDLTGTIQPPKREVLFTKEQTGDRSFVSFMAKNEFISEDTAYTWIKQYSDSLNEKIASGRTITLGKLGQIEKGLLEDYTFTPSEDLNLLESSFSLGELKNVKTFDSNDEKVDLIHTKEQQEAQPVQQDMPKDFADMKSEIELQIENAKKLKEEEKIQESEQQTEQRIIQHSEATVSSEVEKPQNQTIEEIKADIDNATREDKLQQTIERAAEFKENVVVEDIKPAKEDKKEEETEKAAAIAPEDALKKQAEEIVKKHSKKDKQVKKVKRTNKRTRNWLILLWIIITLLLLCAAFVGCHWFGLFKDIEFLKPVTDKLSYYIPVRESKPVKAEQPLADTNTESAMENTDTEEIFVEQEKMIEEPAPIYNQNNTANGQTAKANTKQNTVKKNNNKEKEQEEIVVPQDEPVVEDNTPVVVQNHSKLGFDVVSGSYADKAKAQEQAKKARRLGYDGYVISKLKNGTPVYYVSYGSRRTNSEATDLCTLIKNRLGGDFYIISR